MFKPISFFLLVLLFAGAVNAQNKTQGGATTKAQTSQVRRIDTVAVSILDRMSAIIGELGSCSVTIRSNYDITSKELGLIKHSDEEQLFYTVPTRCG